MQTQENMTLDTEAQLKKLEQLEIKRINFVNSLAEDISRIANLKKDELYSLLNLEDMVTSLNGKDLRLAISKYLTANEKNFLKAKELSAYSRIDASYNMAKTSYKNMLAFQKYGTSESPEFNGNLEKIQGGYKFHLPPMPGKKLSDRHAVDGRFMHYLMSNMLAEYERTHSEKFSVMSHPVAIFVHHIERDNKLTKTLDSDNVDEKAITDALYGFLLSDDNLLTLWTTHIGVEDDSTFCDLYLIEKNEYPNWVKINSVLFTDSTGSDNE